MQRIISPINRIENHLDWTKETGRMHKNIRWNISTDDRNRYTGIVSKPARRPKPNSFRHIRKSFVSWVKLNFLVFGCRWYSSTNIRQIWVSSSEVYHSKSSTTDEHKTPVNAHTMLKRRSVIFFVVFILSAYHQKSKDAYPANNTHSMIFIGITW